MDANYSDENKQNKAGMASPTAIPVTGRKRSEDSHKRQAGLSCRAKSSLISKSQKSGRKGKLLTLLS